MIGDLNVEDLKESTEKTMLLEELIAFDLRITETTRTDNIFAKDFFCKTFKVKKEQRG